MAWAISDTVNPNSFIPMLLPHLSALPFAQLAIGGERFGRRGNGGVELLDHPELRLIDIARLELLAGNRADRLLDRRAAWKRYGISVAVKIKVALHRRVASPHRKRRLAPESFGGGFYFL